MAAQRFLALDDGAFRIHLRNSQWVRCNGIFVRGQAFINDELLDAADLATTLTGWYNSRSLQTNLPQLNGFFAAIIVGTDGTATLVGDKCRSIPLYYSQARGRYYISDDAQWVADQADLRERDSMAALEFEFSGFVQGAGTLLRGLSQVQAGELVTLQPQEPEVSRKFYFQHVHSRRGEKVTSDDFHAELSCALRNAVGRLVRVASGRQICLSLSGGSDSTMIALELKTLGYGNLRCYTYGRPHSNAVRHSQRVAAAMDIAWDCAEYTPQIWQHWFGRAERAEYYRLASGLSSLPLVEDWPALAILKSKGFIDDDAVIVNGQTAEAFLYPVHVEPHQTAPYSEHDRNIQAVAEGIILGCYTLGNWSRIPRQQRDALLQKLERRLAELTASDFNSSLYEAWVAAERMAKFNINSVRNYEFWGHDWWLPLWDDEIRRFWCSMPMSLRMDRVNTRAFVATRFRQLTGETLVPGCELSGLQRAAASFRRFARGSRLLQWFYHIARRKHHAAADFRGWYGLFDQAVIEGNYHPGQNINSLLALEYLGRTKFAETIRSSIAPE